MIEWMRRHMVWMMWIIVGLITVTFLFFGIYPSAKSGRSVAKVGDYVITAEDVNRVYRNLYDNYKDLLKDKLNESVEKSLKNQGLRVSDEELQAVIMKMPAFSRDGRFDKRIYEQILNRINMTPAVFEANQ